MDDAIQQELLLAFPVSSFPMTIRGVREGVDLADDFLTSAPFMASPLGLDLRGQIRRVGIMFRLHELCVAGDLPFSSKMPKMDRANWHQLELISGKFVGNLTRTDAEEAFPEDRPSRQDERLRNQGDLFQSPKIVPLSSAIAEIKKMTSWLMYRTDRKGQIHHLCWGAPAADVDEWLGFVNVIKMAGDTLPVPAEAKTSVPDPKAQMRFRDHIAEALTDREDDASNDNGQ